MARYNEEKLKRIHVEALREFDDIQSVEADERAQCYEDRRFCMISSAQWEGPVGEQFENKPRFEFNRVQLAVMRIFNEYRANRIDVLFEPKDGEPNDEFADALTGLLRADEKKSVADEAYDNAFDEGTSGGIGAWRLRAEYEDDDDEEDDRQTVCIEPIFDADRSVFFDLGAKRHDKADAKTCFVVTPMPRAEFEDEWPEALAADWPTGIYTPTFDWVLPDVVYVCEYYRVEEKKETVIWFTDLTGTQKQKYSEQELKDDPTILEELTATGWVETKRKRVERKRCFKYLMTGSQILEECGEVPGGMIPIVPFYAKRSVIGGIERYCGHVRLAKDAQRLTNTLMSWLAEIAARSPVEVPIVTPEQITGHQQMWSDHAISPYPYLLLNPLKGPDGQPIPGSAAPTAYSKVPNVPPAMAALMQLTGESLQSLLGSQQAGEELHANLSGKAVELVQNKLDMQTFIYMSNFGKAMKRSGQIWLAMKKALTREENRKAKTVSKDGVTGSITLNQPTYDAETDQQKILYEMAKANFEPDVEIGPSSSSKRAATVRAITGLMTITQDPETIQVLTAAAIMNMEGEGLGDYRDYYRSKLVSMGAVKPTKEEQEELMQAAQNQQPDPNSQYLLAAAAEAAANAQQAKAKTVETITNAELKRAQTAETYAKTMETVRDQQLASAGILRDMLFQPVDMSQIAPTPGGA
ncbi:MAG: hypothetical protein RL758_193 [Pseudomonadota bacterium]|jgi:hypothetical protein